MKRLTFAFVIVLSLFVLGGCDKLLEGFFPYDTDTDQSSGGSAPYALIYNDAGYNIELNVETWFDGTYSYDPDGWIEEWYWEVEDDYGTTISSGYDPEFSVMFTTEGAYTISLVVKDNQGLESPEQLFYVYASVSSGGTEITYDNTFGLQTVSSIQDYTFTPDAEGQYLIYWEDSYQNGGTAYTADVGVAIPGYYPEYVDSGYTTPLSIYVAATDVGLPITISVNPIWNPGTCTFWVNKIQN